MHKIPWWDPERRFCFYDYLHQSSEKMEKLISKKSEENQKKNLKKMSKLDVYLKYLNFIHKFKFFGPPMYQEMGRVQWCLKISILSDIFQQLKHRCNVDILRQVHWNHWLRKYDLIFLLPHHQLHCNIDTGGADQVKNANIKMDNLQNRLRRITIWGVERYLSTSMGLICKAESTNAMVTTKLIWSCEMFPHIKRWNLCIKTS